MDLAERTLYHQIHPLKLATDIGVTPVALFFLWGHRPLAALVVGFVPPIVVSAAMIRWPPDLERRKASALGRYVGRYLTPAIEAIRLVTLGPMAYGAWKHEPAWIAIGVAILVVAWANGVIWPGRRPALGG
jgi:hypothetical protein